MHFVNPNMLMLTFNVILRYQGLLLRYFLWFCFYALFFSIWPTDPKETHSTLNEKNKGGWLNRNILILKCENTSFGNRSWTIRKPPNILDEWNGYPEIFSLCQALEISRQYLPPRTDTLQNIVAECPCLWSASNIQLNDFTSKVLKF